MPASKIIRAETQAGFLRALTPFSKSIHAYAPYWLTEDWGLRTACSRVLSVSSSSFHLSSLSPSPPTCLPSSLGLARLHSLVRNLGTKSSLGSWWRQKTRQIRKVLFVSAHSAWVLRGHHGRCWRPLVTLQPVRKQRQVTAAA